MSDEAPKRTPEQYLAAKLMAEAFEMQMHPIALVRVLLLDTPELIAWREGVAKKENMTPEQVKGAGLVAMGLFKITQEEVDAWDKGTNAR